MKIIEVEMGDLIIIVRIPLPVIDGTPKGEDQKENRLEQCYILTKPSRMTPVECQSQQ